MRHEIQTEVIVLSRESRIAVVAAYLPEERMGPSARWLLRVLMGPDGAHELTVLLGTDEFLRCPASHEEMLDAARAAWTDEFGDTGALAGIFDRVLALAVASLSKTPGHWLVVREYLVEDLRDLGEYGQKLAASAGIDLRLAPAKADDPPERT
jgi:hypothetical protein